MKKVAVRAPRTEPSSSQPSLVLYSFSMKPRTAADSLGLVGPLEVLTIMSRSIGSCCSSADSSARSRSESK